MRSLIRYNSKDIYIRLKKSGFGFRSDVKRKINRSGLNVPEIIVFSELRQLRFQAHFSEDTEAQLWAWWSWAEQGGEFSFAVDPSKASSTTLTGVPSGSPSIIPVTSVSGFSVGDKVWIEKQDRTDFEAGKIQTVGASSITLATELNFSGYLAGDFFQHREYFSNLIAEQKNFKPALTDIRDSESDFFFKANFHFSEAPS